MKRPLPTGILVALICSPFFLFPSLFAQVITNGDLNGNVGVSSTPFSWTQVPNTASFSFASGPLQATSDVTSLSGPLPSAGINGNPYTGTTLVSGLKMRSGATYFWHEGIRQTVFGFTPGNAYTVTFYQTVVKQSNVQDNTGLWDLYLDNTFIASSSPTTSTLVFNSNNLPWEQKQISFTATSTAHTLSFMPGDDDANVVGMDGVRMGIDNISLSTAVVLPVSVTLNASLISGGVQLDWEVGNNVQADRYFLERSVDGKFFDRFKEGVLVQAGSYVYQDREAKSGTSFYRLGLRLLSGEVIWSEVEAAHLGDRLEMFVHQNVLNIRSNVGREHQVEIFSLTGENVYSGTVQEQLDLSFLRSGIYLIKAALRDKAHTVVTRKVRIGG